MWFSQATSATPLHTACKAGVIRGVVDLIDEGADPNELDE